MGLLSEKLSLLGVRDNGSHYLHMFIIGTEVLSQLFIYVENNGTIRKIKIAKNAPSISNLLLRMIVLYFAMPLLWHPKLRRSAGSGGPHTMTQGPTS